MTQKYDQIAARCVSRIDQYREAMKDRLQNPDGTLRVDVNATIEQRIRSATTDLELDILQLAMIGQDVVLKSLCESRIDSKGGGSDDPE